MSKYLLWPILYLGSVAIYLFECYKLGDISEFDNNGFVGWSHLFIFLFAIIYERINPYVKAWADLDMQTINNVLYHFITNYGDALGKTAALLVIPSLLSLFNMTESSIWPTTFPVYLQVVLGLLLYEFIYYWYHRISHSTSWLWSIHRLHHSAEKLTTLIQARFNIFDIIIELFLITMIFALMGVPERIFLIMEGFMIPATLLSHANFDTKLPRFLSWIVISPSTHRIHHAKASALLNSNFGGFTLFWDLIFGTYKRADLNPVNEVGIDGHETSPWIWTQQFDFLKKDKS